MSNELVVIAPKSIEEAQSLAKTLSMSQLLPDALRQKPADVLATVLAGAELGLAPMQAIRGIAIIKGKPTLSADTMGALVKRRSDICEYLAMKESTAERATYETKRRGDPSPTTMTFSMQDAQRAGLNGDNWRKYPQAMLRARCLSAICRAVYPDLCLGLYDPDELAPESSSPPTTPPERDVTPPPSAPPTPPRTATEAKAQLQAKLATRQPVTDAEVVESTPKPAPKMVIKDESTPSAWERIRSLAQAHGMPEGVAGKAIRELTKKSKSSELTAEDVERFATWLDDVPDEDALSAHTPAAPAEANIPA